MISIGLHRLYITLQGARGLDFISPSLKCINTKLTQIGEQFCGLDVNTPLGGELPITQTPVLTFSALLTAVRQWWRDAQ